MQLNLVPFDRKWLARVGSLAALLSVGGTTACAHECNAMIYFDIVRIELPTDITTGAAQICIGETCAPAYASPTYVQASFTGDELKPKSVSVRLIVDGTAPIDAVLTTKPTTDTHGGCTTQRLVSLRYDADTGHLLPGADIQP